MIKSDQNILIEEINTLKKEKNTAILVHNYQRPEIYKVADILGDSFELARKATLLKDTKNIVFCGVDFMAEAAVILNPEKNVYLPAKDACCPMAAMVDAGELQELQARYPQAATVCYINTYAEVKALSDICCTSANAIKIVKSLAQQEIIFIPDGNLGLYVASKLPEKKIIPWEGHCYVHQRFTAEEVRQALKNYPEAEIIVHPECTPEVIQLADHICSTSQMMDCAQKSNANTFIVFTEVGMIERLKLVLPNKTFLTPVKTCTQMKQNTLELIRDCILYKRNKIEVPQEISSKAKFALDRMLQCS